MSYSHHDTLIQVGFENGRLVYSDFYGFRDCGNIFNEKFKQIGVSCPETLTIEVGYSIRNEESTTFNPASHEVRLNVMHCSLDGVENKRLGPLLVTQFRHILEDWL